MAKNTQNINLIFFLKSTPDLIPDPAHDSAVFVDMKCGISAIPERIAAGVETPEEIERKVVDDDSWKLRLSPIPCHAVVAAKSLDRVLTDPEK